MYNQHAELYPRVELLPISERRLRARDKLVERVLTPDADLSEKIFYGALPEAPGFLYDVFLEAKSECEKLNLKRICGNPMAVHFLGTLLNVYDYTKIRVGGKITAHPHRDVAFVVAAWHDLKEDCGLELGELEKKLVEVEGRAKLGIPHKDRIVEFLGVLYKQKNDACLSEEESLSDYQKYSRKIASHDIGLLRRKDPLDGICMITKLADNMDNLDTASQIREKMDEYVKVLEKTRINSESSRLVLEEKFNPHIYALQIALINSALPKIKGEERKIRRSLSDISEEAMKLRRYGLPRFNVHVETAEKYIQRLQGLESFFAE